MNCKKNVNKFIEDNNYKIMYTLSAGVIDASHIKDEDDSYIKLSEICLKRQKDSGKIHIIYIGMKILSITIEEWLLIQHFIMP